MPRTPRSYRLFQRSGRWYARYYGFDALLGPNPRLAMVAPGERYATGDKDLAKEIAEAKLEELRATRLDHARNGFRKRIGMRDLVEQHVAKKEGSVVPLTIQITQKYLEEAARFFSRGMRAGEDVDVASISVDDVRRYLVHLKTIESNRKGEDQEDVRRKITLATQRKYLNALSNFFRRAESEGYIPPGSNPVRSLMEKPVAERREARWLEVHEAALLLETARTYAPSLEKNAFPSIYPLLATFLLTGGRKSEVFGLAVDDVNFDRKTITFRPHPWRRLKTLTSHRVVPLWPQLEEILRDYLDGPGAPKGRLLFPSARVSSEQPPDDLRKQLDAIAVLAGWKAGEIRFQMFRHTYCAARLQTLDRGAPVSPWTVGRELGHGGDSLVKRVYGHLGTVRERGEVVEFAG